MNLHVIARNCEIAGNCKQLQEILQAIAGNCKQLHDFASNCKKLHEITSTTLHAQNQSYL